MNYKANSANNEPIGLSEFPCRKIGTIVPVGFRFASQTRSHKKSWRLKLGKIAVSSSESAESKALFAEDAITGRMEL
jgi:hypothetical protein